MHRRPLKLRDPEHGGARAGAELAPLLLRHGHAAEAQVHPQVSVLLCDGPTLNRLQSAEEVLGFKMKTARERE